MKRLIKAAGLWMGALVAFYLLIAPNRGLTRAHSRMRAVRAQIEQLRTALDTYHLDTGEYPTEAQGLEELRTNPGVKGWNGPYVRKEIPQDPWGQPYVYRLLDVKPNITASH